MRVKIGNAIFQFSKSILSDNYIPAGEMDRSLIKWLKERISNGDIEILPDNNMDNKKLLNGKRKKTLENINKLSNYIERKYYVNQKPISFIEVAYKTGLSLSTIKRYLKNIIKDKEVVTIPKEELIEKIKQNIGLMI